MFLFTPYPYIYINDSVAAPRSVDGVSACKVFASREAFRSVDLISVNLLNSADKLLLIGGVLSVLLTLPELSSILTEEMLY